MIIMKILKLRHEEKKIVWSISYLFEEKDFTPQALGSAYSGVGISTRYIEYSMWQLDTLYILSHFANSLVWKGGSCVQSYVPPKYRRWSVDIDLNSELDRDAIFDFVDDINRMLYDHKKVITIGDVNFGKIEFYDENPVTGTLNFFRLVPIKHGGEAKYKGNIKVKEAYPIRIQFNYKAYRELGFIAIHIVPKIPELLPSKTYSFKKFVFPHESPSDLLADKIWALADIERAHRGRIRLKDAYDLCLLWRFAKLNNDIITRKIEFYAESSNTTTKTIINAAIDTLTRLKTQKVEALGMKGAVGIDGFNEIILHWDETINDLIDKVEGIAK